MKLKNKLIIILSVTLIISIFISTIIIIKNNVNNSIAKANDKSELKVYDMIISEESYAFDPTDFSKILKEKNRYIITAKVEKCGEATFLPKTEYYNNYHTPCTPIILKDIKILSGKDNITIEKNTIYTLGGDIKLSNLKNNLDETDIKRLGLDKLNKTEMNTQVMRYKTTYSYDLEPNKEYAFIIGKIGNNIYKIVDEGCGIFEINKQNTNSKINNNNLQLVNVVSKKITNTDELTKMSIEK